MAEEYKKVLEIALKADKAIEGILKYEKELEAAREGQKQAKAELQKLNKEIEDNGAATDEQAERQKILQERLVGYQATIKELKYEQGVYTKNLQQQVKAESAEADSLVALRAKLSNLTAEYDALSKADREGEIGQNLQKQINEVTNTLKAAEEDTQRYYRNVGNYENSVRAAFADMNKTLEEQRAELEKVVKTQGESSKAAQTLRAQIAQTEAAQKKMADVTGTLNSKLFPFADQIIPLLGKGLSGVKQAFVLAGQGAQMLAKQFLALMANPIVAFLTLIAAAIATVTKGIAGNEENMNRWNKIMAPVQRGLALVQTGIEYLCGAILSFLEMGGRFLNTLVNIADFMTGGVFHEAIENVRGAIDEAAELSDREAQLHKDQRDLMVDEAKTRLEISKLRKEATDTSNKDYEARAAAAKKAADLELELSEERKRQASEEYEIAKARAEWAGNSQKDNEELARLEAAKYNAEREYYEKTRELQNQANAIEKEAAAERKKNAEEAVKLSKERAKAEQDAIKAAEDAMLALVKDKVEQRRQQIELSYQREIDSLKEQLANKVNLTKAAEEAIITTIKAKEEQKKNELAELDAEILAENIERKKEEIDLMLEIAKDGSEQEYQLKLQQNQLNLEADLAAADAEIENAEAREAKKALIREKYAALEDEMIANRNALIAEEERKAIENLYTERLMAAENNEYDTANIELEKRKEELDNLHQMEGESNADFRARELEAEKAYNDQKKKLQQMDAKISKARLDIAQSVTGGIADAFEALGENNKEFAKMSKILALAEIAINTGKAIAEGVAQAQAVGYPASIIATATTIASIIANVATAIQTVNSAKFAKGGKVVAKADGGKITGPGTGTSDSIPAWLSNGEFVMTANATRLFEPTLEAMNAIGSGVNPQVSKPFSVSSTSPEVMTQTLKDTMQELHPVVSVVDINDGQNRVEAIESLDTI